MEKKELTYDIIVKKIHKTNQLKRKILEFREKYGTFAFTIMFGMSMIGGAFIWIMFDLWGPKYLSFLGVVWGAIWFAVAIAFTAYAYGEDAEEISKIEDCYYVVEDAVLEVRHRPDSQSLLYFSFADLDKYHHYNYIKIPKEYRDAKPRDRFLLVFNKETGKVVFICKPDEYETPFRYKKPTQKKNILRFVPVQELGIKSTADNGVKLDDKNSKKKAFSQQI